MVPYQRYVTLRMHLHWILFSFLPQLWVNYSKNILPFVWLLNIIFNVSELFPGSQKDRPVRFFFSISELGWHSCSTSDSGCPNPSHSEPHIIVSLPVPARGGLLVAANVMPVISETPGPRMLLHGITCITCLWLHAWPLQEITCNYMHITCHYMHVMRM